MFFFVTTIFLIKYYFQRLFRRILVKNLTLRDFDFFRSKKFEIICIYFTKFKQINFMRTQNVP